MHTTVQGSKGLVVYCASTAKYAFSSQFRPLVLLLARGLVLAIEEVLAREAQNVDVLLDGVEAHQRAYHCGSSCLCVEHRWSITPDGHGVPPGSVRIVNLADPYPLILMVLEHIADVILLHDALRAAWKIVAKVVHQVGKGVHVCPVVGECWSYILFS